ncbi:MAG: TonB-dependent receptor [Flammeovirgaceae bacterium]|nr:TonB-dependent receptor [Flammeovirgaceae bacterium]
MRKLLLQLFFMLAMGVAVNAQDATTIKGNVSDNDGPIIGANVIMKGTTIGTVTDIDGNFSFQSTLSGNQILLISFVGYEALEKSVNLSGGTLELGAISLNPFAIGLAEVEVIAAVAVDRKTPVAVTTLDSKFIEEKVGNQEFPEILRSTPSVYVTKQGGGFGDSRINVRGFDQRNTAVMINGIPVNDMENGWVYWSNWAGLSDVASKIQVQRGLGASKLAVASVGGSINIITNAAEMKKGGAFSVGVGNDGYQKYGLVLSTGLGEKGWAFTLQGTHTRGDGYADGTLFRGYSYFASLSKQMNNHSINFTVIGAPQWHFQREYGSFDGVTIETIKEKGIRYNPQWGTYAESEHKDNMYSWRKNFYHKPKAFVNWYWNISDKTELATSAYVSLGRGGGTGDLGRINGSFRTSSKFQGDNGVKWDDIHSWNQGNSVAAFGDNQIPWKGPGVTDPAAAYNGPFAGQNVAESYRNGMILRSSMNEHNWYGVISNLTHELSDQFTFVGGIDARYYQGLHYRRVENVLGLDAYYDDDDINNVNHYITDEGKADGNQIDYNNDGLVNWLGLYGQIEYSYNNLTAFISASGSNQGFKRIDYFTYLDSDSEQKTEWQNFLGGTVKGGVNYNLNENHNVFVNGGYFSRQPIFDNVFLNYRNDINEDIKNQSVYALELGYGYRSGIFSANVNLYHTQWGNRQLARGATLSFPEAGEEGEDLRLEGNVNYEGIEQLHQGIEVDFTLKPTPKLTVNGMLSIANWRYTSNFTGKWSPIDEQYNEFAKDLTLYMDGVKVADAAQTTFSLGANYQVIKDLNVSVSYYHAENLYADFDLENENESTFFEEGNQAWKLPSYDLVDLGIYYNMKFGSNNLIAGVNINNIFDTEYMSESESNILYNPANEKDQAFGEFGTNGSVRNIVYYGFGRTWNASLKYKF